MSLTETEGLAARYREAAGGVVDVVIDFLNGAPAEAAIAVMAHGGRMAQIGSSAAAAMRLEAQVGRRNLLDVLGFAYYHAPAGAAGPRPMPNSAASPSPARSTSPTKPCRCYADFQRAWDRQKAGGAARTRWSRRL